MLNLCGVSDPQGTHYINNVTSVLDQLKNIESSIKQEYYTILLSHRPELINDYLDYSSDLILSGHAHGGQWRIPFLVNGVFAPGEGTFPEFAGGLYSFEQTSFIVSRGLARETTWVPRIFNRPELVIINIAPTS